MNDLDIFSQRMEKLYAIAQEDEAFLFWQQMYKQSEKAFEEAMKHTSKKRREIILSYVEGGRTMMQRLMNIACENMDFTGDPLQLWSVENGKRAVNDRPYI